MKGDTRGCLKLAYFYETGAHVAKSPEQALRWYLKATSSDWRKYDPELLRKIAKFYETGYGLSQPDVERGRWWRRRADAEEMQTACRQARRKGVPFMKGTGTKDDPWLIGWPQAQDVKAWTNETGVLTIGGAGDILVPDRYGYRRNVRSITTIEILDGVTRIGDEAFADCDGIESISLPRSLREIGEHAFANCRSLKSVSLPSFKTSVKENAFRGCPSLQVKVEQADSSRVPLPFDDCYDDYDD